MDPMSTTTSTTNNTTKQYNNAICHPITLPYSNKQSPNRIVKASTTEHLADPTTNIPNQQLINVYKLWSEGGTGILQTGNVQVDRRYMESTRNVAAEQIDLDDNETMALWQQWAKACKTNNNLAIVQLSHGGRQVPRSVSSKCIAPSPIQLNIAGFPQDSVLNPFTRPKQATVDDIHDIINRFVVASKLVHKAGFDGVQIHAAHGYLISTFLSPNTNQRNDMYGGSAENRRRLLLDIVKRIRSELPKSFIVSVKLNSADFQHGGFTEDESIDVTRELCKLDVDYIEYSGGTYESSAMMTGNKNNNSSDDSTSITTISTTTVKQSTIEREAYFISFVNKLHSILKETKTLIMLTGGWRSARAMHNSINNNVIDLIGLARPLCVEPDFTKRILQWDSNDDNDQVSIKYNVSVNYPFLPNKLRQSLTGKIQSTWHNAQIHRLANGQDVDLNMSVLPLITTDLMNKMYWDYAKCKLFQW